MIRKPTTAFVGAGWTALTVFALTYLVALWRMNVPLVEGYFFVTILVFGVGGVIVLTKAIRDREDGIPTTGAFVGVSWILVLFPLFAMGAYLLNVSTLDELQRGLLFLTYMATVFAMVTVQKTYRDQAEYNAAIRQADLESPTDRI